MADIDEDSLNVLLLDPGMPPAVAVAGSIRDVSPESQTGDKFSKRVARRYFDAGLLIGLVLFVLWLLW